MLEGIYLQYFISTNIALNIDDRIIVLHIAFGTVKKCNSRSFFYTRQRKGSHFVIFTPQPLLIAFLQIDGSIKRSRESTNKGLGQVIALIGNNTSIIVGLNIFQNIALLDEVDRNIIRVSLGCRLALLIDSI
ncbi:hypothetical protein D3C79_413450 [compost metagenome]